MTRASASANDVSNFLIFGFGRPRGGTPLDGMEDLGLGRPGGGPLGDAPLGNPLDGLPFGGIPLGNPLGVDPLGNPLGVDPLGNPLGVDPLGNPLGVNLFGGGGGAFSSFSSSVFSATCTGGGLANEGVGGIDLGNDCGGGLPPSTGRGGGALANDGLSGNPLGLPNDGRGGFPLAPLGKPLGTPLPRMTLGGGLPRAIFVANAGFGGGALATAFVVTLGL